MFIGTPLGESGEVVEDARAIGVEDVRAIGVYQHPMCIQPVMRVATDVVALVDDEYIPALSGQLLGDHRSGKAGADHQHVDLHCTAPASTAMVSATPADARSVV